MTDSMRQDVIHALISKGEQTAIQLGLGLDYDPEEVYELLQALRVEGVCRGYAFEDVEDGPEFDPDEDVMMDSENGWYVCGRCDRTHGQSEAYLCAKWVYCGGPVSQALAGEAESAQQAATTD